MEAILSVSGVVKSFGDKTALNDLSFSVDPGEIFGFLGPSGAGKTTTIKLLTRQLRPDAGDIRVFGKPVAQLGREDDRRMGVLSDNSGAYERLSVWDNVRLFASLRGVGTDYAAQTLEEVGLGEHRDKPAKALSRGMKQRLLLAQSILHQPELLFLDEPTASLDPATAADIHRLLRRLGAGGATIFLTTHNMEEADKLCSRVAFLNEGQIAETGDPEQLKLKYAYNQIKVLLDGGETVEVEKTPEGLGRIAQMAEGREILQIHSREPNLEEIFLSVTGRKLI